MKTKSNSPCRLPTLAVGVLLLLFLPLAAEVVEQAEPTADAPATKDEISATGTVFSVEPEILSVVMKDNPAPVRFSYSKTTPFLDEKGEAVPLDLVRGELPLTVYYEMEGEQMVARRVIVTRSMVAGDANEKAGKKRQELAGEKAAGTGRAAVPDPVFPREITGLVSTIEQTISVVARGDTVPTTCVINNSTRYVNVSGQPVGTQWLIPGMPISVKTVQDGKRLIAREIVVRGNAATLSGKTSAPGDPDRNRGNSTSTPDRTGSTGNPVPGSGYVIPLQVQPPTVPPTPPGTPAAGNQPAAPGNNPAQPPNPDPSGGAEAPTPPGVKPPEVPPAKSNAPEPANGQAAPRPGNGSNPESSPKP